jgi:hypothetical protein
VYYAPSSRRGSTRMFGGPRRSGKGAVPHFGERPGGGLTVVPQDLRGRVEGDVDMTLVWKRRAGLVMRWGLGASTQGLGGASRGARWCVRQCVEYGRAEELHGTHHLVLSTVYFLYLYTSHAASRHARDRFSDFFFQHGEGHVLRMTAALALEDFPRIVFLGQSFEGMKTPDSIRSTQFICKAVRSHPSCPLHSS